jgi:peptidase S41-like protein
MSSSAGARSIHAAALAAALFAAACTSGKASALRTPGESSSVANLHAFARLYGIVRWFHPSDAAAAVDWDRVAIDGVRRVIDVHNAAALRRALAEIFQPIAPTIQLVTAGERFADAPDLHPANAAELQVVSWEHAGYGDSAVVSVYASKRRHRARTVPVAEHPYGAIWQAIDAAPFRGVRVRFRGQVRTRSTAKGQLWLRIDRGNETGFFDDMRDRPVISRTWEVAEVSGTVDPDATRIVFGTMSSGSGTTWYDELELSAQSTDGRWSTVAINDPSFEDDDPLASWKPGLARPSVSSLDGWKLTTDRVEPAAGSASLRVEPEMQLASEELFADTPRPGETVDVDLGTGLRARIPIALYSKDGHTVGDSPDAARRAQRAPLQPSAAGFDATTGIADVITAWNVLEHFWPYWDAVSVDWQAELDVALRDALDDRTVEDHVVTLERLSAAAPDGHARVTCSGTPRRVKPPFTVEVIQGRVVVTASADPAVIRGDIVVMLDGRPAAAQLADDEKLTSGSPQARVVKAAAQFGAGPIDALVNLVVNRGGIERRIAVARSDKVIEEYSRPAIERMEGDVYYVDLSRVTMTNLDAEMSKLANAAGIVFDVRRRPNSTHPVLSHLLKRPDDSKNWLAVPHVIRPDHVASAISGWDSSGWEMPVLQPHIAARVAFLTGPVAQSYAESIMGLVEYYHLGEIVGSATAGTNGNVAEIAEPSGCVTRFTGMRVTKSDGSRFHLIGIQPTIPASRTIAGVVAGRDEVLERALAYVRTPRK